MLNNLRELLRPVLEKVGKGFASVGVSPNAWTAVGLAFAAGAAIAYGWNFEYALIVGGILLLISGFFDIVDGQVARVTGKASKRGAFLDSVSDKVAEAAIFLGIMIGGAADPAMILVAAMLSLLVSYSRARSESLGVNLGGVGIGERAERLIVLALVGMAGMMDLAMIIVSAIAGVTLIHRTVVAYRNIRD